MTLLAPALVAALSLAGTQAGAIHRSAKNSSVVLRLPFSASGEVSTTGWSTFLYWSGGALVDVNSSGWAATGSPASVTTSPVYPAGFAGSAREGSGPLSDSAYYALPAANDALDCAGGVVRVCLAFSYPSNPGADVYLYSNGSGSQGQHIYLTSSGTLGYRMTTGSQTTGTVASAGNAMNVACGGYDGANSYIQLNLGKPGIAAKTAPTLGTGFAATIGRDASATGKGTNATIYAFAASCAAPDPDLFYAFQRRFLGMLDSSGRGAVVIRGGTATHVIGGTTWTVPADTLRIDAAGALLNTDTLRLPRGVGVGGSSGRGSFTVQPAWAYNGAGGDRHFLTDWPQYGSLAAATLALDYISASAKWRLTVNGTTVDSAAQTFAANAAIPIAYRYKAGGSACLTVTGAETCSAGAVSAFTAGSVLTLGTDTVNTGANAYFKDVQVWKGTGAVGTPVLTLGDSITLGTVGDASRISYPKRLGAALGASYFVDSSAVTGDTLNGITNRWRRDVKGRGYRYLVLLGGINDIRNGGVGIAASVYPLWKAIADEAKAEGLKVVPLTLLPFKGDTNWSSTRQTELDAFNVSIAGWCTANSVTCIDAYADFNDSGNPQAMKAAYAYTDWLHPNQTGNDRLATLVQAAIP